MERKKKIKIAIVVLAVLLCVSLLALGGTLVYNRLIADKPGTVLVPDNLITPDDAATSPEGTTLPDGNSETKKHTEAGGSGSTVGSNGVTQIINAAGRTAARFRQPYSRTTIHVITTDTRNRRMTVNRCSVFHRRCPPSAHSVVRPPHTTIQRRGY